jgi:hypothetical protein
VLPQLKNGFQNKINKILSQIPSVNTTMDAWTDVAVRPLNGFVAQGIDVYWKLYTIQIEFDYMDGNY